MVHNKDVKGIIKQMPKIELHLHLEGAFTFEFLYNLITKYGGNSSIKNVEDLKQKFVFRDFSHFIETWFWKNQFFKKPEDFGESAYHILKNLHQQNVVYAEVFYSPWDFVQHGLRVEDITESTLSAIERAEEDFGIKCQLIADLCRDYGAEKAIDRFKQVLPYRDKGLIGIGLGGSERDYPPRPFKPVYDFAKEKGFHLVAHAGEAAGSKSVWDAISHLGIERIGHGVRSIEDRQLIETLKENQIPLEICVTSNLKTGVFSSLEAHPVKYFFDHGLVITINSDDPTMFGATITDEFLLLYEKLNFTFDTLKKLCMNAIKASFLSQTEKESYKNHVHEFFLNAK